MEDKRKQLQEKILSIGGKVVYITHPEEYVEEWLDNGEVYDGNNAVIEEGAPMLCEENSLNFYLKHKDEGIKICTGFALNNDHGMWVYHAWCKDKEGIVHECTPVKRDVYYGITLDERQTERFRRSVDFAYDAECARKEKSISTTDIGKRTYEAQKDTKGKNELGEYFKALIEKMEKGKGK